MVEPRSRAHARRIARRAKADDPTVQAAEQLSRFHISTALHMPFVRALQRVTGAGPLAAQLVLAGSALTVLAAFAWLLATLLAL